MTIEEYEALSGKVVPADKREMMAARIEAAISYIDDQCCGRFSMCKADDGTITLPNSVKMGVVMLVDGMGRDQSVSSYSLAGMSKSFFQGGDVAAASKYWQAYACGGRAEFF